jgi:ribosomal protein L10
MDRAQKSELITGLAQTLSETSVIVVARNHGLTVAQVTDLRNKMRQAGASFKVTKNRLARIALEGDADLGGLRDSEPGGPKVIGLFEHYAVDVDDHVARL